MPCFAERERLNRLAVQGTILDRIDYNMEVVTTNFEEAHKHLEAVSLRQTSSARHPAVAGIQI